jgi:hypothetical protein
VGFGEPWDALWARIAIRAHTPSPPQTTHPHQATRPQSPYDLASLLLHLLDRLNPLQPLSAEQELESGEQGGERIPQAGNK